MSAVPDAVVTFLLDNLLRIITDKYNLIANESKMFDELQEKVGTLKARMTDFARYNQDSAFVKKLVEKIRFRVTEAEDAVDNYVLKATGENFISSWMKKRLKGEEKAISEAITKLDDLNREIEQCLIMVATEQRNAPNTNEARAVEERNVIGFDDAAKEVSRLLTGGPEQFEVVSIVGMLGLGKTTLAKKIFNGLKVDGSPYIPAFVSVSRKYEKKKVFLDILDIFGGVNTEVRRMNEYQLERHLQKQLELENNKFVIVLDDVCEEKDWNNLKNVFPNNEKEDNKKRCRVLITTRNQEVAEQAEHVYKLDFLPLDKSRELLRWKVFNDNDCRVKLEEHERDIAEKCGGLPMAIVSIAGLFDKRDDNYNSWHTMAQSVNGHIANETKKEMEQMYLCLEKHLKLCFLYLGIFPENFEIPVWKLVRLWIGEGFIEDKKNLVLEDTAERYLEELVRKHLLIVVQRRSNDKPKTCRLHNMFREFCRNKAKEEYLFRDIKKDVAYENSSLDHFHAICINNVNNPACKNEVPSGKGVRSFLTFGKEDATSVSVSLDFVSSIPKKFQLLRVMEMQSLIPKKLSNNFSNLLLLKYAAIHLDDSKLPWEISKMRDMETLIVHTTSSTLEIKPDIWKIPYLRHLHTNVPISICPDPDAKKAKRKEALNGENLLTLSVIAPESCRADVFDQIPKLRKLGISGQLAELFKVGGQSYLSENLKKLERLENLKLLNDNSILFDLPLEKSCAKHLTKLTLSKTLLQWKHMSTIADLEKLEVLKLKENAFQGSAWKAKEEDFRFPNLKQLQISNIPLVVWEISKDNFPNLKRLKLKSCKNLEALPRSLGHISGFQLVVVDTDHLAKSAYKLLVLNQQKALRGNNQNRNFFKISVES